MSTNDILQIGLYIFVLIIAAPILGAFMAKVFDGKRTFLHPLFSWLERLTYKICGVRPDEEMRWQEYAKAMLWFNAIGFGVVFILQMAQQWLPLNPQQVPNTSWHLAFNTAVSFMTNTNWQSYGGETTMSNFTQMLGLAVQNFVSAATGIAVFLALARGIARKSASTIGNFWTDMTRSVVYILLPLSILFAVILVSQGVVQSFDPAAQITTVENGTQTIPLGPAASQIAIKQLGSNGGGFFNANSAVPFENPTPLANFLEMLALLLLAAGLVFTYGHIVKARRHSVVIFAVMMVLFLSGLVASLYSEYSSNNSLGLTTNMEGKETRFGVANSVLWSVATTDASNGSVNAMHSSMTPVAGGIALFNIMLGEIIFGGLGAGMYGMLLFVLLTVFLAGLMVGRTPEYLGKKIEAREIQMTILAILAPGASILVFAGIASVIPLGLSSLANAGPHGLSEILYAFSSAAGNNGSAFAGLNANTTFYNVTLGITMLIGRFAIILPALAIAGMLAAKKTTPASTGTFSTDNGTFAILLIGVIIIVGALTFLPALSLGPIIEQLLMHAGRLF